MSSRNSVPKVSIHYFPSDPEKGVNVIMRKGNYRSSIKQYHGKEELRALREEMLDFFDEPPAKKEIKMTGFSQEFEDDFMRYLGYSVL
jgi:hypothetical protein